MIFSSGLITINSIDRIIHLFRQMETDSDMFAQTIRWWKFKSPGSLDTHLMEHNRHFILLVGYLMLIITK